MEWEPDAASKTCRVCGVRYTLLRRRHHCRRCGRLVCQNCSKARLALREERSRKVRVCSACSGDIGAGGPLLLDASSSLDESRLSLGDALGPSTPLSTPNPTGDESAEVGEETEPVDLEGGPGNSSTLSIPSTPSTLAPEPSNPFFEPQPFASPLSQRSVSLEVEARYGYDAPAPVVAPMPSPAPAPAPALAIPSLAQENGQEDEGEKEGEEEEDEDPDFYLTPSGKHSSSGKATRRSIGETVHLEELCTSLSSSPYAYTPP
jgi:hypothetical protein